MTEQIRDLLDQLERMAKERDVLRETLSTTREKLGQARGERDRNADVVIEMQDKIDHLNNQVEELSVSPLDLDQQRRVKALTAGRDVVAETGSASMFHKTGGTKVSLAGVLSVAHFITTGRTDYVIGEGEYIDREHQVDMAAATQEGTNDD